jgi:hypothetical protein
LRKIFAPGLLGFANNKPGNDTIAALKAEFCKKHHLLLLKDAIFTPHLYVLSYVTKLL